MSRVVLVAVAIPSRLALEPAVRALEAAGAAVDLVVLRESAAVYRDLPFAAVHVVAARAVPGRPLFRLRRAFTVRVLGRLTRRANRAGRAWLGLRFDPWVRDAAGRADVLVALDVHAVYGVWRLSRRNRRSAAYYGLDAAVRAVQDQARGAA